MLVLECEQSVCTAANGGIGSNLGGIQGAVTIHLQNSKVRRGRTSTQSSCDCPWGAPGITHGLRLSKAAQMEFFECTSAPIGMKAVGKRRCTCVPNGSVVVQP